MDEEEEDADENSEKEGEGEGQGKTRRIFNSVAHIILTQNCHTYIHSLMHPLMWGVLWIRENRVSAWVNLN